MFMDFDIYEINVVTNFKSVLPTFNFGMETMLGSLSKVGGSAQPCLSPNHSLCRSGSLVARLLAAVQGVSEIIDN